jgi:hypothetical protein
MDELTDLEIAEVVVWEMCGRRLIDPSLLPTLTQLALLPRMKAKYPTLSTETIVECCQGMVRQMEENRARRRA